MKKLIYILILSSLAMNVTQSQSDFGNPEYTFGKDLANMAYTLTEQFVIYDGSYTSIDYPNGDVAADRGVCTDVVIRAYRKMGIDLQVCVHVDMLENFDLYPKNWGLTKTDSNIDHRRVPNLMKFFERWGQTLPITDNPKDYKPGDIICWDFGHIGIVSNHLSNDRLTYKIVHNIGAGQNLNNCLFGSKIIGHYSFGALFY
jgi:uncharacterized protein YijF (DUF1287 family)